MCVYVVMLYRYGGVKAQGPGAVWAGKPAADRATWSQQAVVALWAGELSVGNRGDHEASPLDLLAHVHCCTTSPPAQPTPPPHHRMCMPRPRHTTACAPTPPSLQCVHSRTAANLPRAQPCHCHCCTPADAA